MLQETIPGTRDIAQRWINADRKGAETLAEIACLSECEGDLAWQVFVHVGLARADPIMGQPEFRHGGYMERDIIRRAVEHSAKLLATRATPWRKRGRR